MSKLAKKMKKLSKRVKALESHPALVTVETHTVEGAEHKAA